MTLIEMVVAIFAGIIVSVAVMLTCIFVAGSFHAIGNYSDMDKASRTVLDNMSRNIRGADHFASTVATNSVTITNLDGSWFAYVWDPANNTLSYKTNSGGTVVSTILLTNCDTLSFQFYQRNVTNDFQFVPTTVGSEVKMISVAWRCSKAIYGRKVNTESVQTAQIAIRN